MYIYLHYTYIYTYIIHFSKFGKNSVNGSLLSQNLLGIPNIAGVYEALHGSWWCESPSGVWGQIPKSADYLKIFRS